MVDFVLGWPQGDPQLFHPFLGSRGSIALKLQMWPIISSLLAENSMYCFCYCIRSSYIILSSYWQVPHLRKNLVTPMSFEVFRCFHDATGICGTGKSLRWGSPLALKSFSGLLLYSYNLADQPEPQWSPFLSYWCKGENIGTTMKIPSARCGGKIM